MYRILDKFKKERHDSEADSDPEDMEQRPSNKQKRGEPAHKKRSRPSSKSINDANDPTKSEDETTQPKDGRR